MHVAKVLPLSDLAPNQGTEPTPDSVRCAPASGRGSYLGVSAPSEAWRFLQGASPCGVRPNQPLLPSVAPAKEAEDRRTTQVKRTQGTT